ncbi:MAG: hypothetical protein ETSY1_21770 [Candidatus Entotheonella factor]|uniref:Uncharacterized protein n=1 Tax=Entotheonella factor TaxID=1429438 RepID=W4LHT1_ENTF1|nr:MAG: hypothetical protein ETSY1_21770 [Candidatus Entotheonella factor]
MWPGWVDSIVIACEHTRSASTIRAIVAAERSDGEVGGGTILIKDFQGNYCAASSDATPRFAITQTAMSDNAIDAMEGINRITEMTAYIMDRFLANAMISLSHRYSSIA